MSRRRCSCLKASSVIDQSSSNIRIKDYSVNARDRLFACNRIFESTLFSITRFTIDDWEFDDAAGAIECDTEDDDCVPGGHASDEELEDHPVEYNATIEDDMNIEVGVNLNHHSGAADNVPLIKNTKRLNQLPISQKFTALDGTEWAKEPYQTSKKSCRNVLKSGGPTKKRLNTLLNIFNFFLTQSMKIIIICHTNRKGHVLAAVWNEKNPYCDSRQWQDIDEIEFDAFLALLLIMGVHNSTCEQLSELWTRQANCIYRASMSRDRFKAILTTLRFDDANTREARKVTDKAAAISELWLLMNDNLAKNYMAHDWITIDEQLIPFHGRVSFKQYNPSKPAKYGLKVFWAVDAVTHYPLGGMIYLGRKSKAERACNMSMNIVLQLLKPYENSGRNITTNDVFTTLSLAEMLATRNLTLTGRLPNGKPYIPNELLCEKRNNIDTPVFAFRENCTMVAYTAKHTKQNVILLSSRHYESEINATSGKSQIILDYNSTKGGVDTMDQMLAKYSCKRKTNRWSLAMFFNMIDVMTLAAYRIFIETQVNTTSCTTRRGFITKLAAELAKTHISRRALDPMVIRLPDVRSAIEDMLDTKLSDSLPRFDQYIPEQDSYGRIKTVGKCFLCPWQCSTRRRCMVCKKSVCAKHTQRIVKCLHCQ